MDIKDLNTLCYIHEQVCYPEENQQLEYKIVPREGRFYIVFDSVLQSFGVMNRNRRMYKLENVWNCIQTDECIQDMLANNSWFGEMDHPAAEYKNTDLTLNRIGNPNPGLTSHYIRRPYCEGNLLKATIQTDSGTEAGRNMAIKIVDGGIRPAFSARVLGEMSHPPVVDVKRLITYDWVLYPSHREARASFNAANLVTESANNAAAKELEKYANCTIIYLPELARMAAVNEKASQTICEAFDLSNDDIIGLTNTGGSVVIKENQNMYVAPITDNAVRTKMKSAVRDFLNS